MRDHRNPSCDRSALLIDPSVVGQSHLLVNTGVAQLAVASHAHVTIIAEATHCSALKQYLDPEIGDRITFVPWNSRSEIRRTVRDTVVGRTFDQIIFTNIEYNMFAYMTLFHARASRKPILWMFHSHFVTAAAPGNAARIKNIIKWYLLFRASRRVKFIVLGERIRANVEALIGPFFRRGNIAAVFHPVGVKRLAESSQDEAGFASRSPRVLFIPGWHALSPENQDVLNHLERIPPAARAFEVVALSNRFKESNEEKSFSIEYADRLKQIAEADFFLHLPSDSYQLQASGAVMDMLLTGTPMIGLRTDFGEELAGIIGPFGYFFADRAALLRFLSSGKPDPAEVRRFRANLAAGYDKIVALSQAQFDAVIAS